MLLLLFGCGKDDDHNAVDLGLSVLWADCNVRANLPEEFGGYYSWGDTMANRPYGDDCSNYPHCKDMDGDGCISSEMDWFQIGDDISGIEQYDVAAAEWGNGWKMPTKAQFEELLTKCSWVPCEKKGVKGFQVVGPNGNSIFLPIAGKRRGVELESEVLFYWTSTVRENKVDKAWSLRSDACEPIMQNNKPDQSPIRPVKMRE